MLSIQEVKNAKAGDKARKFYDRDGLYLFVTPAGGKYWRGKYRVNGREKTLSGRTPIARASLPLPAHLRQTAARSPTAISSVS